MANIEEIIEKCRRSSHFVEFEMARNKINIEPRIPSTRVYAHTHTYTHISSSSGNIQWKGFVPLTWQPVPVKRREMDRRYMRFNQYVGITSRVVTMTRPKTTREGLSSRYTRAHTAGRPAEGNCFCQDCLTRVV